MPTKEDYIYAAGLFDGEGCITRHSKKSTCFDIIVRMTNKEITYWFKEKFGGNVTEPNNNIKNSNWKKCYVWRLVKVEDSVIFLKNILLYSKNKKQRIKVAINLGNIISSKKYFRIPGIKGAPKLGKKELKIREKLLNIIKKENIRGFSQEVGVV